MPIITLTTDMGLRDYYVAAVKGAILKQIPDARIVDISHEVAPFNIIEAAFILKNSYPEFPPGTIHIVGVNYESAHENEDKISSSSHVAIEHKGHYFIGSDSGVFSMIFDSVPEKTVALNVNGNNGFQSFAIKNSFVNAAAEIARGTKIENLGKLIENSEQRLMFRPIYEAAHNTIRGVITYIDSYGNIFTNITQREFVEYGKGRAFEVQFGNKAYNISQIVKNYNDVPPSERLALFGANGYLEIAVNQGSAAKLLGMKMSEIVRIHFF